MSKNRDKKQRDSEDNIESLKDSYTKILSAIGEDLEREGVNKTPERVAKSILYLTHGYELDPIEIINSARFEEAYGDLVIVKNIEMYSLCEHHMLPFYGKVHVAYIPDKYIVGLSKIGRVVDALSRRLQVQERLTMQIRSAIDEALSPLGVAVSIEASHMCMQMRGVQKQSATTMTTSFSGVFADPKSSTKEEFLRLIKN